MDDTDPKLLRQLIDMLRAESMATRSTLLSMTQIMARAEPHRIGAIPQSLIATAGTFRMKERPEP